MAFFHISLYAAYSVRIDKPYRVFMELKTENNKNNVPFSADPSICRPLELMLLTCWIACFTWLVDFSTTLDVTAAAAAAAAVVVVEYNE